MTSISMKFLRTENKRLLSLVSKLTGTIETIHFQLEQKEDTLAKRRIEVATLHQACAEYKRTRRLSAATPLIATPNAIKQAVSTIDAVYLHCQQSKDTFSELKAAIDSFAQKLSTALSEKDSEIAKLVAALAEQERKEEERRQLIERIEVEARQSYDETRTPLQQQRLLEQQQQLRESEQRLKDIQERKVQHERESAQRMEEIKERKLQHERQTAQELRYIEEEHVRRVQAIHQRAVVQSRQRRGVADAA